MINKKGFTLIELLAVIVVLAIVSVIATTLVVRYMSNARIDAFAVEASNVISSAKNAVSMNDLNKLEIENDDNSCKVGNRMCFTIDTLIELGVFKGNKDIYDGKVDIDISDKQNLKYKLYLEKKNEFNIIDSNVIDYSKNKDIINKGNFSGDEVEQYTICSCIEDKTKPTIMGSALDNNTTSPKIKFTSNETGTYCVNTSSLESNIENCVFEGTINANEEVVTDAISTSHTYYVHVKDEASNVGVSTSIDIVKTICNPNTTFSSCLLNAKTTGFNSTMEGGLYRYQGTSVDNYICFGTNNDCLNYPNRYYYQIIGVNSNGQVKIIKSKTLI